MNFSRTSIFIFIFWFVWGTSTPLFAQLFLEFSWTLENTEYEGLLYVPQDQSPTMTVRVLGKENVLEALVQEKVELIDEKNGTILLQCGQPRILWGDPQRKYFPEKFIASNEAKGRVSNGIDEAFYEINTVGPANIESIMKKYLLDEIQKEQNMEMK
ncbi:MAG: hypothetical protein IJF17_04795 [Thermoguttaceae bacterium]|nr:hypothetical protein [Thermoguttaceae bacterium]MDO4425197.1 hypothetical protein [Planctomycetia bacterium]